MHWLRESARRSTWSHRHLTPTRSRRSFERLENRHLLMGSPVNILPLGDSITQADFEHSSYRRALAQDLDANSVDYDFVGSLTTNYLGPNPNPDFDLDHEGRWGIKADEVLADLGTWLQGYTPDIVLLHLGTNDLKTETVQSTLDDLEDIVDELRVDNPNVSVLLAQIFPIQDPTRNALTNQLNAQIPALAASLDTPTSRVIVVDQNTGIDLATESYDGKHPNLAGEEEMATKWFAGISFLLGLDPVVWIDAADNSAAELGSDPGQFVVHRGPVTTGDLIVNYSVGGNASAGDYSETLSGTVTIPDGQSSVAIDVTPIDDSDIEGDENVQLTLTSGAGYVVGTPDIATLSIVDDDSPVVSISLSDATAGETGPDPGQFTIDRGAETSGDLTVNYTIAGTADTADYSETLSGSVTILNGQNSAVIDVTPVDDSDVEGDETLQLTLATGAGYTVGSSNDVTLTITDNDSLAAVAITLSDSMAAEELTDPGQFTIDRGAETSGDLTVNYTISGTANAADYSETLSGSVTILDGQTSAVIDITPVDDSDFEGDETLQLTLAAGTGYTIGSPSDATLTITDNEQPPTDLIAHFALDGNTLDSTVNHDGATSGGATYTSGVIGQGLSFSNGQLTVPSTALAEVTGDLTAALWIKPNTLGSFSTVFDAAGRELSLWIHTSTFGWYGMGGKNGGVTFGEPFTLGEWQHVTYVKSGAVGTLYRNGIVSGTTGTSSVDAAEWVIGGNPSGGGSNFDGVVDEVRLYNRALSAGEVLALASATDPIISISLSDPDAAEELSDPGQFAIDRGSETSGDLTVNYTIGGTADAADYSETLSGSVTILDGQTSAVIDITPVDDSDFEGDETLQISLATGAGYTIGASNTATLTILENDSPPPAVSIHLSDATSSEEGTDAGQFTVDRGSETSGDLTVNYTISGTADTADYSETLSGSVTILDGQTSAVIDITPVDDSDVEGDETLQLTLAVGSGYTIGSPSNATLTITDNDNPPPAVAITLSDSVAAEELTDAGQFTVDRGSETSGDLTVNYTISGTADSSDYSETLSGSVTILDGQISAVIDITPVDDSDVEGDETLQLTLAIGSGYTIGSPSDATLTISDNDSPIVAITVSDATSSEEGTDPGQFTIDRGAETSGDLTVNYTISGTANAADYSETLSGSVTILNGQTSAVIDVTPVDDSDFEGDETLQLTLAAGSGYTIGSPSDATLTITDNDNPPPAVAITLSDSVAAEELMDAGQFTIDRGAETSGDLTVNYTISGTANAADYSETLSGSVTILDGQTSAVIDITPVDDSDFEGDETLQLTLAAGTGYTIGSPSDATLTITDNEQPPTDLIAHFALDGNTLDSTGNHDGATSGGATYTSGVIGQGLSFSNGQLTVPSTALAEVTGDLTAALWIKPNTLGSFSTVFDAAGRELSLWIHTSTFGWYGMGGKNGGVTFGEPFTLGEWQHVTYVKSGAVGTLYRNGIVSGTTGTSSVDAAEWVIGGNPSGGGSNFDGVVDEVRLYNRALSAGEVLALASATDPIISISLSDPDAAEELSDPGQFAIDRGSETSGDLTVNYTIGGTADAADYSETLSGSVTILDGQTSAVIDITPVDDSDFEGDETLQISLATGAGYTIGASNTATLTILENDSPPPAVSIHLSDATSSEEGTDAGQFTVDRGSETSGDLTVNYTISGTADTADYSETLSGSVTILDGQTSAVIDITPVDDSDVEGDETLQLTLAAGSGYAIGSPSNATLTITDNDNPPPAVAITLSDSVAAEELTDAGQFTVDRGSETSGDLTVNYTISGTADSSDYSETLSGSVTILDGQISAVIDITPVDDSDVEGDETLQLTLAIGSGYTIGSPSDATLTISDNDSPIVAITVSDATSSEEGTDPGQFTVDRGSETSGDLTVNYTISGTANAADYSETLSGSVTILNGQTSAVIDITPVDDSDFEGDETLQLTLAAGSGYTIGSPSDATLTITDNDNPPPAVAITLSDSMAAEELTDPGQFTIDRGAETSGDLTVNYTISGTADSADYSETLSGSVTILDGQTSAVIDVTPVDDSDFEGDETLQLTLAAGTDYTIGSPSDATLTITDNEQPPTDLIAHFELESNADDATGNHDGAISGGATYTTGIVGQGLSLTNGQLTIPSTALGSVSADVTAALWIHPNTIGSFSTVFDAAGRELSLWIHTPTFGWYGMGGKNGGVTFSEPFTTGEWQHIAYVKSGVSATLYRNGIVTGNTGTLAIDAAEWVIGGNPSGGGSNFDGIVDDVRLYNRALSQAEIVALVNGPPAPAVPMSADIIAARSEFSNQSSELKSKQSVRLRESAERRVRRDVTTLETPNRTRFELAIDEGEKRNHRRISSPDIDEFFKLAPSDDSDWL